MLQALGRELLATERIKDLHREAERWRLIRLALKATQQDTGDRRPTPQPGEPRVPDLAPPLPGEPPTPASLQRGWGEPWVSMNGRPGTRFGWTGYSTTGGPSGSPE